MNTPFNSHAWRALRQHAADQLPSSFADNVLRTARASHFEEENFPWVSRTFSVTAITAAVCLCSAVLFHIYSIRETNLEHAAAWQEISVMTASLDRP